MLAVAVTKVRTSPDVRSWSRRFLVLADPNQLTLLLLIHHAGPIRVCDLVWATGRPRDAVVQSLRLLRGHGAVIGRRSEGAAWYVLTDYALSALLAHIAVDDATVTDAMTTVARIRSSAPDATDQGV